MLVGDGFHRVDVVVRALARLQIPDFSGSMLRGALGHALARVDQDAYAQLFETQSGGHAFVITPPKPQQLAAGSLFSFQITLLESEPALHQHFFHALDLALRKGLGEAKVACELVSCTPVPPELKPLSGNFRLVLSSPWFVKYRGEPVMAHKFGLDTFLIALCRRQRDLVKQGYLQAQLPDNQTLLELAGATSYQASLRNVIGERRSNRQQVKHRLQGVVGYIDVQAMAQESVRLLEPVLQRAQWLHGGAKVSFGQGALQVQALQPSSQLEHLHKFATGAAL